MVTWDVYDKSGNSRTSYRAPPPCFIACVNDRCAGSAVRFTERVCKVVASRDDWPRFFFICMTNFSLRIRVLLYVITLFGFIHCPLWHQGKCRKGLLMETPSHNNNPNKDHYNTNTSGDLQVQFTTMPIPTHQMYHHKDDVCLEQSLTPVRQRVQDSKKSQMMPHHGNYCRSMW